MSDKGKPEKAPELEKNSDLYGGPVSAPEAQTETAAQDNATTTSKAKAGSKK